MAKATAEDKKGFFKQLAILGGLLVVVAGFYMVGDDEENTAQEATEDAQENEEVVEVLEEPEANNDAQEGVAEASEDVAETVDNAVEEEEPEPTEVESTGGESQMTMEEYERRIDTALYGVGTEIIHFGETFDEAGAFETDEWSRKVEDSAMAWRFVSAQHAQIELPEGADESQRDAHESFVALMETSVEAADVFMDIAVNKDETRLDEGKALLNDLDEQTQILVQLRQ